MLMLMLMLMPSTTTPRRQRHYPDVSDGLLALQEVAGLQLEWLGDAWITAFSEERGIWEEKKGSGSSTTGS